MPFAEELTAPQLADLRDDVYWATVNVAYCPSTVVFQALTNQAIAQGVFAEFAYDGVTIGDYTDIKVNMVVILSLTTNIRYPLWVGRIRELPTSTVLKINETAIVLQEELVVTVIDDRRLFEKLWRVDANGNILVDWNIPYAPPAPLIYNMQSGYVNPLPAGSAVFEFEPEADPVDDGETITGWLWDVEDGTITVGTDTDQNITAEFPQGFRWVRLTVTSSNGQSNFMDFAVWVGTEYVIPNVIMPQIQDDLEEGTGYTVTIQGYTTDQDTLLRTLLNKTLVCLFSTEYFSPAVVTNIDMMGRFINEDGSTRGDEQHSVLQEVGFEVQGIGARIAALSASPFRLEDSSAPATWGQMVKPTPDRFFAHMATRGSTLSQICSIQLNSDNAIYIDKSLQNEETSLGAGAARMYGYMQAKLNFAPSGEIRVERDALYVPDVTETVVHFDWEQDDIVQFQLAIEYQETAGQVVVVGSRYTRATGKVDYFTASAPPTSQGEGEFVKKLDGVLIPEGLDNDAAETYLAEIAGRFFALSQPLVKMSVTFFDSWRNVLIPNCFQWYTFDLPADSNPRGLIFTAGQRWMLLSISRDVDTETGRNVTVGEFVLEPNDANAQILAAILADAVAPALPSIPVIDAYPAFPPNPVINYPNDNPGELDLQPIDIGSGYQGYSPLPQDAAQEAANNAGSPGCQTFNVFFSNPSNETGFILQNGELYVVTVDGDARISVGTTISDEMTSGLGPGTHEISATYPFGLGFGTTPGTGVLGGAWQSMYGRGGGGAIEGEDVTGGAGGFEAAVVIDLGAEQTVTQASFWYNFVAFPVGASDQLISFWDDTKTHIATNVVSLGNTAVYKLTSWSGSQAGVRYVAFHNIANFFTVPLVDDISVTYGTANTRGDAFYHSYNPEAGGLAQAYISGGLFLQNAPITVIPAFNPQHRYTFPFTGDGNTLLMRYAAADHSQIQNVPMILEICGPGAGSYRR